MQRSNEEVCEGIFPQLLALLQGELGEDLQGVLVTGSRIHGTPSVTSDLDVHVIVAFARRRRKSMMLEGVEIEMFFNPAEQIRAYFQGDGIRGIDQHMFAFGRAIYDPVGIVAELQEEARNLWEAGPMELSLFDMWARRYFPADMLRDLEDVIEEDEGASVLLIAHIVEHLVETHFRLNRRWLAKPKRRLSELEKWDVEAARLARRALLGDTLEEKYQASHQLAVYVLKPIGGELPLEWEFDWQGLS